MVPSGIVSDLPSARVIAPSEKINIGEEEITMRDRSALSGMPN